jgi:hypothetical protein
VSAGDRPWPGDFPRPGKQPWLTAEFPAVKDIPYLPVVPEPRRGGLRTAGKHRSPDGVPVVRRWRGAVLAGLREAVRRYPA